MSATDWDIRREGRSWTKEEVERRLYQAPEKIEFVGGIFASERERLAVLAMLLENLGIDKVVQLGKLADWKSSDRGAREARKQIMTHSRPDLEFVAAGSTHTFARRAGGSMPYFSRD